MRRTKKKPAMATSLSVVCMAELFDANTRTKEADAKTKPTPNQCTANVDREILPLKENRIFCSDKPFGEIFNILFTSHPPLRCPRPLLILRIFSSVFFAQLSISLSNIPFSENIQLGLREIQVLSDLYLWKLLGKLRVEPASGVEPPTCGLRNRCSATELRRLSTVFSRMEVCPCDQQ